MATAEIRAQVGGGGVRVHRAMQSSTPDLALPHPSCPWLLFLLPNGPMSTNTSRPRPWHLCLSDLSGGFISPCCPLLAHWVPQFKSKTLHFLVLW